MRYWKAMLGRRSIFSFSFECMRPSKNDQTSVDENATKISYAAEHEDQ